MSLMSARPNDYHENVRVPAEDRHLPHMTMPTDAAGCTCQCDCAYCTDPTDRCICLWCNHQIELPHGYYYSPEWVLMYKGAPSGAAGSAGVQ